MHIPVLNRSRHPLPEYQTAHAAGLDVRANLAEPVTLKPLQRALIPTGLFLEIPVGYEMQVRPRSGLAYKHGIGIVNSPGTIDADYRGELKVLLVNLSDQEFVVQDGERIAQLVVARHETVQWQPAETLTETQRGTGGYGSTGVQ
ncbi:deoxyuridine 5'-triphosphate nucleotidohydrolase [Hymenobacter daecheongensis DSM 21074]|uniref:Deoxyuridine 5'-triphosphate nucleotidohydrolase n=1 Tax=Hymenobacter daecheongensis DSM 21074 TaxID=1121955 RepID=A0A1M6LFP5_9BACT|nr:dUTP diphosphatase [Hymenobacter daecheongensis]SHJ70010.1 deoxyuridine 5'-triphosphate nucleotidohydrolase [Hymenobacter daecheongensis DSM 21074]